MNADSFLKGFNGVGEARKWTRQIKQEEKRPAARMRRNTMWAPSPRVSMKSICWEHMEEVWNQASNDGKYPTHWRQMFYVMRPIVDDHAENDKTLTDDYFKTIIDGYLDEIHPGWDVIRGARGVFKEPHRAENDSGLPLSTLAVRDYILERPDPTSDLSKLANRFPTHGSDNRFGAVIVCEKEGFDEQLSVEQIPEKYDLALMSTKGISARAARDLAESLAGVQVFTLHDFDKNGFVMAAPFLEMGATDFGLRLEDVEDWELTSEAWYEKTDPEKTYDNLIKNGATDEEAEFISGWQRVELNMLTSERFIQFVESKLEEHGVEKVIPDDEVLGMAWKRAKNRVPINKRIEKANDKADEIEVPDDLADRILERFAEDPELPWDDILEDLADDDA